MILNLNPHFNPFPRYQNIDFESFFFAGGEPYIRILSKASQITDCQRLIITHRINSFNDFGLLLMAIDAVQRMGAKQIFVLIPYFPAARQDRLTTTGESLSIKVYAQILNQIGLAKVIVFDPHSDVTAALLDNCQVIPNFEFIKQVIEHLPKPITLLAPDAGAAKKIYQLSTFLNGLDVVECGKIRDAKTGDLSGFKVFADDLQGKNCLIVDDICDGGGTFLGLARVLKSKNVGDLYLAVSHGIFSKGLSILEKEFKHIFSTDAFRTIQNDTFFTQIKLADCMSPNSPLC